jgi:hypothetical protein
MPIFTIESSHHLPIFRHSIIEADTVEKACKLATQNDDWSKGAADTDSAGATYVSGIWLGHNAYEGEGLPIPSQFDETVVRRSVHFDEMLVLLTRATQLMPVDAKDPDISTWLARARTAIEKAEAILADTPDPDQPSVLDLSLG